MKRAAQQCSPFPHPQQPHRFRVGEFCSRYATAIVFYFQVNSPARFFQMDRYQRRARVPNHIRQGLLEDTKERRAQVGLKLGFANIGVNIAFYAGTILKLIGLPFQSGCQPQVVQHPGAKFS